MARKVKDHQITAPGRDQGKTYRLTEMAALSAEAWGTRAFLALARAGANIPPDIEAQGLAGLAQVTFDLFARCAYADVEPLLSEMLTCVQIVVPHPTDANVPPIVRPATMDGDYEEIATLVELRREVIGLHVDFSAVAAWWKHRVATRTDASTSDTPTSSLSSES